MQHRRRLERLMRLNANVRPAKSPHLTIEQLWNIGPTVARRLKEIGIHTEADLRAVGSVAAYQRICAKHPGKTVPVCYYLYSLEGALRNQHWDTLGSTIKQNLLRQVSSGKGGQRKRILKEGAK
jgi:DNA transformation protein